MLNPLPTDLWHYTSPDAALAILSEDQMRATMIHYMNDSREFEYALDIAREVLEVELGADGEDEECKEYCAGYLNRIRKLSVFAASFSTKEDDLSQWRAYCPVEGGHALRFDPKMLQGTAHRSGFELLPCIYEKPRQLEAMRPVAKQLVHVVRTAGEEGWDEAFRILGESFALIGAQLKDPAFYAEGEWRLISGPPGEREVSYLAKRALIVPYLNVSFNNDPYPLVGMRLGPHRHPDLASRSVRLLTSNKFGWPFKVEESAVPFRSLD